MADDHALLREPPRLGLRVRALPRDERRLAGRRDELDEGRDQSRPRSACDRASANRPGPASSRNASDSRAPSSCARLSQPQSKRAAPGLG